MASKIKVDTLETANGSGSITLNNPIAGFESTGIDDNATSTAITIDASERVGIGAAPTRNLHVQDATGACNVSIRAGDLTSSAQLVFGDTGADNQGYISYLNSNDSMNIGSNGATAVTVDSSGIVTKPLQPAFQATATSQQANIPVNSQTLIAFAGETFDIGSNFASSTFTAPVTGKYHLTVNVRLDDLDSAASYYQIWMRTSNRDYVKIMGVGGFDSDVTLWTLSMSILADMDAGDTVYNNINQSSGTSQTDIDGDGRYTNFSGYLVA